MSLDSVASAFPTSSFLPPAADAADRPSPTRPDPFRSDPFRGPSADAPDRLRRTAAPSAPSAPADITGTILSLAFPAPARLDLTRLSPDEAVAAALFVTPGGERLPTESLIRRLTDGVEVTTTVSTPQGFAVTIQAEERRRQDDVRNLVRLVAGPEPPPPPRLGLTGFRPGLVLGPGLSA
jgi:hypothetical protein